MILGGFLRWINYITVLNFPYVTILFSSNKLLELKYIHHYAFFFLLTFLTRNSQCILWTGKYGTSLNFEFPNPYGWAVMKSHLTHKNDFVKRQ